MCIRDSFEVASGEITKTRRVRVALSGGDVPSMTGPLFRQRQPETTRSPDDEHPSRGSHWRGRVGRISYRHNNSYILYNDLCQTEEREPRRAPVKPVDNELGDD